MSWSLKSNGPVTSNCSIGVRSFSSVSNWIFACAQVHFGGLQVGFVLDALQFQSVEINLRDVAGT